MIKHPFFYHQVFLLTSSFRRLAKTRPFFPSSLTLPAPSLLSASSRLPTSRPHEGMIFSIIPFLLVSASGRRGKRYADAPFRLGRHGNYSRPAFLGLSGQASLTESRVPGRLARSARPTLVPQVVTRTATATLGWGVPRKYRRGRHMEYRYRRTNKERKKKKTGKHLQVGSKVK